MPTRIILVRHGDSQHKVEGTTGGPQSCKGLTETGRQQAARLRDRLAGDSSLTAPLPIYSSIVPRAIETAQIVAEAFAHAPVQQDCGLCSWHIRPEWEGKTWAEVFQDYNVPGGGVFRPFQEGAESWAELVGRVGRALMGIAQRHRNETVLVVCHKESVEASLIVFGDLPLNRSFDAEVANASLTEWITEGDTLAWPPPRWTLVRFNDAAHLSP